MSSDEFDFDWSLIRVSVGFAWLDDGASILLTVHNDSLRELSLVEFDYIEIGCFETSIPRLAQTAFLRRSYIVGVGDRRLLQMPPDSKRTRAIALGLLLPKEIDYIDGSGDILRWTYRPNVVDLALSKVFRGDLIIPGKTFRLQSNQTGTETRGGTRGHFGN